MKIIIVIIVLLLIASIGLFAAIYYLKTQEFKFYVDGKTVSNKSTDTPTIINYAKLTILDDNSDSIGGITSSYIGIENKETGDLTLMVYLLFFVFSPHLGLHLNTTPRPHILAIPRPDSFVVLCKKETRRRTESSPCFVMLSDLF